MAETVELPVEFLFTLRLAGAGAPDHAFDTPWGERRETRVMGGSFAGPRLSGEVVEGLANDWGAIAEDGTVGIDANLVLRTEEGEAIFIAMRGRQGADGHAHVAPIFESSDGPNAWLTEVMCIGSGKPEGGDLVLDIYAIL